MHNYKTTQDYIIYLAIRYVHNPGKHKNDTAVCDYNKNQDYIRTHNTTNVPKQDGGLHCAINLELTVPK